MKKSLLIAAALVATLSANAQGEKDYFAKNISGLSTTTTPLAAGTACGSTSLVDATIGADDSYKLVSVNGPKNADGSASYRNITFDGVTLSETEPGLEQGGVQGNSNPKDVDGGTPSSTLNAPVSGAYFQFKAKADGYLYVVGKLSSNKSYTVFEEGSAIPYQYAQGTDGAALANPATYDLTGTGTTVDGVENITLADHPAGIMWPEQIIGNCTDPASWTKIGQNGVGFIGFPVFEGLTYIVNANGSKFSGLGFYTSTTKAQNVALTTDGADDPIVFVKDGVLQGGGNVNGIKAVSVDSQATLNAMDPMYNLAGQRVTGAYKGVVLQNGHKFINK